MTRNTDDKYYKELQFLIAQNPASSDGSQFWEAYARYSKAYLAKHGFENFRSGDFAIGDSYANMLPPRVSKICSATFTRRLARKLFPESLANNLPSPGIDKNLIDANFVRLFNAFGLVFYHYLAQIDSYRSLVSLEDTLVGNPTDIVVSPDRRKFSVSILFKYLHYFYLRKFISKFPSTVLEIGGGAGFLGFVIEKIHPGTKYVLVDLPEQLAVAYFFLDNCFPGKVMPYSEVVKRGAVIDSRVFQDKDIILIPHYATENLNIDFELGIGTATFQEMNRETVISYMKFFDNSIRHHIYIYGGDGLKSHTPQTKKIDLLQLYADHLPHFDLQDQGRSFFDPQASNCSWFNPAYRPTFWTRKI